MRLKKSKRWNANNCFFLVLLLAVFAVGCSAFIREETLYSDTEKRELATFEHFEVKDFVDGTFQTNFESALSDQFPFSENVRVDYAQAVSNLPDFGLRDKLCQGRYIELASDDRKRGVFDCDDYIVYMPEPLSEEKQQIVEENIAKYNHINELVDTYYYYVDDPSSFDFRTNKRVNDYYGMLKEGLVGEKKLARLSYDDYAGYKGFFYKNDHHWDYRGSYQGYLDIAKMLGIEDVLAPADIYTNHEDFYGSYARTTNTYDFSEEFKFYDFKIPEHKVLLNGVPGECSHYEEYKKHEYEYSKTMNYYAFVYGDDYAEVEFDFDNPSKENLLIISNSYSNAVNELIGQYFNKTYVIDLRAYKEEYGHDFVPSKYIKDKDINKTLIIMSPTFIWAREPNRGLEL